MSFKIISISIYSDGPVVTSVGPSTSVTKLVGQPVELTCTAQGHPEPSYTWVQVSGTGVDKVRSTGRVLRLPAVQYTDQGVYVCSASNLVKGEKMVARSETVTLEVQGSPVLAARESSHYVVTGTDARVTVEFCADPRPQVTWIRRGGPEADQVLEDGGDGYAVEQILAGESPDCYSSALTVERPDKTEVHEYLLRVKNQHGEENHRVYLKVIQLVDIESKSDRFI